MADEKRSRDGARSPSVLSTASSAAPLVRHGSSTSKTSCSSATSFASASSSSSDLSTTNYAKSPSMAINHNQYHQRPKMVVSAASIAAAQLQCQQQRQQLHNSSKHLEANAKSNSSPIQSKLKFKSANESPLDGLFNIKRSGKNDNNNNNNNDQSSQPNGHQFGYETGKAIAYNATR